MIPPLTTPIKKKANTNTNTNTNPLPAPHAQFILNNNPAVFSQQLESMFAVCAEKLSAFGHGVVRAWDVPAAPLPSPSHADSPEPEDAITRSRTVLYESVSRTVFKADAERRAARVGGFNVVELEGVDGDGDGDGDGERGFEGLWAVGCGLWAVGC